ncbi:MAG: phytanoyl-CoA dioxygenase family protein [Actinomycetota bacterium]|nr:phytanoyl-CoA dioxygenase family protein [Actinomycetota bacterium]
MALTQQQVDAFVADGFVRIDGGVPAHVARQCQDELWLATGYDPDDPTTWADTLVRIDALATPPFREAAATAELHEAFDQLVGRNRWLPRSGLGTFPLRFPGPGEPKEAGWHVESSFTGPDGSIRLNLRSRGRALLMLFLFSDVGPDDAPTLIRVGSHLDVPAHLRGYGEDGREWMDLCKAVVPAGANRPVSSATGRTGDVYLCHPFVVHSAQQHRGSTPRFMAQPPLLPTTDLDLAATKLTPVAQAVVHGLRG